MHATFPESFFLVTLESRREVLMCLPPLWANIFEGDVYVDLDLRSLQVLISLYPLFLNVEVEGSRDWKEYSCPLHHRNPQIDSRATLPTIYSIH